MTVKELIEALKVQDPDDPVFLKGADGRRQFACYARTFQVDDRVDINAPLKWINDEELPLKNHRRIVVIEN